MAGSKSTRAARPGEFRCAVDDREFVEFVSFSRGRTHLVASSNQGVVLTRRDLRRMRDFIDRCLANGNVER